MAAEVAGFVDAGLIEARSGLVGGAQPHGSDNLYCGGLETVALRWSVYQPLQGGEGLPTPEEMKAADRNYLRALIKPYCARHDFSMLPAGPRTRDQIRKSGWERANNIGVYFYAYDPPETEERDFVMREEEEEEEVAAESEEDRR